MSNDFELRGKRVLVVGLARTGIAVALFCAEREALVTASDVRNEAELGEVVAQLRESEVTVAFGAQDEKVFTDQDLIVPSPGVPADLPGLLAARTAGVTVWSEIELADRFLNGKDHHDIAG